MKRNVRLTRSTDFQRVRRFGKSYAHPLMVLVVLPNSLDKSRFGVAAGRSVGNAVRRNRAKRLLREAWRLEMTDIPDGWDLLAIARRPVTKTTFQETKKVLVGLLRKANLYQGNYDN